MQKRQAPIALKLSIVVIIVRDMTTLSSRLQHIAHVKTVLNELEQSEIMYTPR